MVKFTLPRALVKEINDYKLYIYAAVEGTAQRLAHTMEEVNSRVEDLASEVKAVSTAIVASRK
jgi:hypothetical protein